MPYLAEQRKQELDEGLPATTPGDLTYLFTKVLLARSWGREGLEGEIKGIVADYFDDKQPRYADYALVLGCLTSAVHEFFRRRFVIPSHLWPNGHILDLFIDHWYSQVVAPYEDAKILQNGDVYR
jgi:hypothetical protein